MPWKLAMQNPIHLVEASDFLKPYAPVFIYYAHHSICLLTPFNTNNDDNYDDDFF